MEKHTSHLISNAAEGRNTITTTVMQKVKELTHLVDKTYIFIQNGYNNNLTKNLNGRACDLKAQYMCIYVTLTVRTDRYGLMTK